MARFAAIRLSLVHYLLQRGANGGSPLQLFIENLSVDRGTRRVLAGFNLRAPGGETILLTGPNGAGKTTLIRTIGGFLKAGAGIIRLEGGDPERDIAAQCHYVGHLNGIKASLTVAENLEFWRSYLTQRKGGASSVQVLEILDTFGLGSLAAIPTAYLSTGQKRRVGLARLLAAHRPIWLLDEPSVSLDAAATELLARLIEKHTAMGGLVIAATHVPLGVGASRTVEIKPNGGVWASDVAEVIAP